MATRSWNRTVLSDDKTKMQCIKCKRFYPLARMSPSKLAPTGHAGVCVRCANLWRMYRITSLDYEAMLERQGGVCAICGSPPKTRISGRNRTLTDSFHVDHSHVTGKVRALLCDGCNHGIGSFGEDAERLCKAAEYIERWKHAPSDAIVMHLDE